MLHKKKYVRIISFGLLLVLFFMHYPFLDADPDTQVSLHTRGAWTDEGLYTSQIRNLINHDHFDLKENSTFVRGPFLNILQLPFFYIFGTSLQVSRLITLILTLLVLFLYLKREKYFLFGLLLLGITFTQYHVFQFSHYGLAEIICIDFILLSLFFMIKYYKTRENSRDPIHFMILAALFLFLSYATKIQFLYVAIILPLTVLIKTLGEIIQEKKITKSQYLPFFWSLLFTFGFALLYFLAWYLPNMEFYNYIMESETSKRFPDWNALLEVIKFNYKHLLFVSGLKIQIILFYISLIIIIIWRVNRKFVKHLSIPLIFGLVWVLIELHKIPMVYLPTRYFLSLIIASGLLIAVVFAGLAHLNRYLKYITIIIVLLVIAQNTISNYEVYKRQSWDIKYVNDYLSQYDFQEQPVIGSWASTMSWDSKAITFPVWNNYFNYKDPINTYNPRIVVSENDESESDHTYESQGIDLKTVSDSSRIFKIWRYTVIVYWMKEK
ncbi:hypothetical protein ACFL6I_12845 [candidate division KSB1 bacterium]